VCVLLDGLPAGPVTVPSAPQLAVLQIARASIQNKLPVNIEGLPRRLAATRFSEVLSPASRWIPTSRDFASHYGGRSSIRTVLSDPVQVVAYEPLARMSTGSPSLARLASGRLLLVHERRPPKGGVVDLAYVKLVRALLPPPVCVNSRQARPSLWEVRVGHSL
jgi:hypothetical protein